MGPADGPYEGDLRFIWNFVDPQAEYQKIEMSVLVTPEEVKQVSAAFTQVSSWSKTARENRVRRAFDLQLTFNDDGSLKTGCRACDGNWNVI